MDETSLPTHRSASPGLDRPCAGLQVDHCFDGWDGHVWMEDAQLRVHLSSDLRCLVAYTLPEQAFFAVEPVSHVNNAINMAAGRGTQALQELGVQVLPPGGTMTAQMRIDVEPA
jgi:aldose 1-epimerase